MLRLPLCVALLLHAAPALAQAQTRYPRAQPAPAPVVLSDRVKPQQAAPPAATTTPKPAIDVNAVLTLDALAGATRAEQEQILAQLIENTPDSEREEKADYYFRLAIYYTRELRNWTRKAADPTATPQAVAQASNQAKMNLLKAVKVYKGLTDPDTFRDYPKMDVALFHYGYALQLGRYLKEARAVYDKLLKNYPSSLYVPTAHLAFGEYYYDSGQLADADARYKQVLKFPKSDVYWYAMYKLGWLQLQLQKPTEALEMFAQVVFGTRGDLKRKTLHDAAARDFVHAYAQAGKVDKALDVFTRIDKTAAPHLVELIADAARARGAHDAAVTAYRQLLSRAPADPRACQWQYRIAHGSLATPAAPTEDKIKEIVKLVDVYMRSREDDDCRANTAAMTGELAAAYHYEWSKTRNPETLGYAEQLYAAHAAAFPGPSPQQAAYAEVLWVRAELETHAKARMDRWQRAADAFVAAGAPDTGDAPRAAALAGLNALDFVAPTKPAKAATRAGRAGRALPIKAGDAKLLAAFNAYLAQQPPADAEVAQVRLAAATLLRRYNRFEDATTILDHFLADHADHASAEYAALLLLDAMVQARSADLPQVVSAMSTDLPFVTGKPALLQHLQKLRTTAASSR